MALKVGELFASFNLDTSGLDGAVKDSESKLGNIGKGLNVGAAAAMAAVGVAAKKAATAIYEAGSGFDAQMSKVFAIAGDEVTSSQQAMDDLSNKALEMGSTTKFTAKEAGQAFEYMAMAGWKADAMMGGIEPILNLAAAAGEDLGVTSDIVTDAMTAFGYTIDKVGGDTDQFMKMTAHFTDVLAAASSNANTNVSMMGESFKYTAPIAGAMGYSIEDTAVALGLLANSGIKASQAGTTLRTIMTKMNGEIKIGGKNMKEVTIKTTKENGEMRDFMDIIKDCREAFQGLTESEKTAMAESLVGRHAMAGFLALMNSSASDVDRLTEAISTCEGATEKMADMMLDNAAGDVTLFKSAVEGLEVTLWHLAEGSFRDVVKGATDLVNKFRTADPDLQLGSMRIAAMGAAAGPVVSGLGMIAEALPGLGVAIASATTPAGLLTLGLVALGAAAVDTNNTIGTTFVAGMDAAASKISGFAEEFEKSRPGLEMEMAAFLGSMQTGFTNSLPEILTSISGILTTGIEAIANNSENIGATAQALVSSVAKGVSDGLPDIIKSVSKLGFKLFAEFIKSIPTLFTSGALLAQAAYNGFVSIDWAAAGATIHDAVVEALKGLKESIFSLIFGPEDAEANMGDWEAAGKRLVENISKALFGAVNKDGVYGSPEGWKQFGVKLIDMIFAGVEGATDGAAQFASGLIEGISGVFNDANMDANADALAGIAGRLIEKTADMIPGLADKASMILQKIAELIFGNGENGGIAESAMEGANTLAQALMKALVAGIPKAASSASQIISGIGDILNGIEWSEEATALTGIGEAIIKVIAEGIKGASDIAVTIVETIGSMFSGDGIVTKLAGAAKSIASGLLTAIVDALPTVAGAAVNILGAISKTLFATDESGNRGIVAEAATTVSSLATGIADAIADSFTKMTESGDTGSMAAVLANLIDGMIATLPTLFAAGGQILSAGAKIGKAIMDSIASALSEENRHVIADSISKAATDLVKNLLTGVGDLATNTDVTDFIKSLGTALGNSMNLLGDVTGKLLKSLFSAEGLEAVFNAGKAIIGLLWDGIKASVGGLAEYMSGLIQSLMGLDPKTEAEALQMRNLNMAEDLAQIISGSFGGEIKSDELSSTITKTSAEYISSSFRSAVSSISESDWATAGAQAIGEKLQTQLLDTISEAYNNGVDGYITKEVSESYKDMVSRINWTSIAQAILDNGTGVGLDWETLIINALFGKGGEQTPTGEEAVDAALKQIFGETGTEVAEAVTEQAQATGEAAKTAAENAGAVLTPEMTEAFANASAEGTQAAATAIDENTPVLEEATLKAGDGVVQTFMMTLSEANGTLIGTTFVTALVAAISGSAGAAAIAAASVGSSATNALRGTAGSGLAYGIGQNFGQGFVNGIRSMIDAAADAANAMGAASTDALSNIIKEGSPSKITEESGINYALGYENSIARHVSDVEKVSKRFGAASTEALQQSVSGAGLDFFENLFFGGKGYGGTTYQKAVGVMTGVVVDVTRETKDEVSKTADTVAKVTDRTLTEIEKSTKNHVKGNLSGPIEQAMSAASYIATAAGRAMMGSVSRVTQSVSRDMEYIPHRNYVAPNGEHVSASNDIEPVIQRFAGLVTDALSNVGVYMDGEPVGHIVAQTVSEDIAHQSQVRRYATV